MEVTVGAGEPYLEIAPYANPQVDATKRTVAEFYVLELREYDKIVGLRSLILERFKTDEDQEFSSTGFSLSLSGVAVKVSAMWILRRLYYDENDLSAANDMYLVFEGST